MSGTKYPCFYVSQCYEGIPRTKDTNIGLQNIHRCNGQYKGYFTCEEVQNNKRRCDGATGPGWQYSKVKTKRFKAVVCKNTQTTRLLLLLKIKILMD